LVLLLLEACLAPLLAGIAISLAGLVAATFLDITTLAATAEDRRLDVSISIGPLLGT